jgi:hypothetical protein
MTQLRLTPFGIAVPPLIPDESLTPEQVQAIQQNAQVIGTLLSPDLHTTGILVVPENVGTSASSREAGSPPCGLSQRNMPGTVGRPMWLAHRWSAAM